MEIIIWILIFIILAGLFNGFMDVFSFKWNRKDFNEIESRKLRFWLNPNQSWKLKYKLGNDGNIIKDEDGNPIPRFLFSDTIFVFLTDAWHKNQFWMFTFFTLPIALVVDAITYFDVLILNDLIEMIILRTCISIGFHMSYSTLSSNIGQRIFINILNWFTSTLNKIKLFITKTWNRIFSKHSR